MFDLIAVPLSIQPIQNKTVTEGDNVTLSCQASGTFPPMVSWIKFGGKRIAESELVLTNINRSEAGEYKCEASNECGNASERATIDVQCKSLECITVMLSLLRVSPHENHAGESTVHLTDFLQIWNTCVTSLVHQPRATVWFNFLLFWRNVNQAVRQWKVFKFEVKIYIMFDRLLQVYNEEIK